ncbi:hypothetical protein HPB48_021477 [Haemaphysalis longicornis]|uniref:Phospholipid scramblase n=1 Tax=Haemaphysalis longicornis TaxID=44386 RepID=A0A9J6GC41_HAELO|nr:hypothetical protein HPB48_021477 [Haemaphysalis longicornis]
MLVYTHKRSWPYLRPSLAFPSQQVRSMNGIAIGAITKKWSGLVKEYFTDIDNFGVSFPMDLDVHLKATLLATTMLIVSNVLLLLIAVFT